MKYIFTENKIDYCSQITQMKNNYESYLSKISKDNVFENHFRINDIDTCGGSIALNEKGDVVAWLKIIENKHDLQDSFLSILVLYDLDLKRYGYVIKSLYGIEVERMEQVYYEHKVYCSAYDMDLLQIWYELGFGLEQAYGYAKLEEIYQNTKSPSNVKIEELNEHNKGDFEQFYSFIATTHARAPIFSGASEEYLLELKEGFKEVINDKDAIGTLAYDNTKVVGYQVWSSDKKDVIELTVSGTKPKERGKGICKALTAYGAKRALEHGYNDCITDWRTANPYSSSFWPLLGFKPYKYRLIRRLSKRVLDNAQNIKKKFL